MGLTAVTTSELPTTYAGLVDRLVENGYAAIPARPESKQPAIRHWQRYSVSVLTPERRGELARKFSNHGVFCHCDGFIAIDIDVEDAELNSALTTLSLRCIGPALVERTGRAPRRVILYRVKEPIRSRRLPGLEVRSHGSGVMLFGMHPDTHRPYYYSGLSPLEVPVDQLPIASAAAVEKLLQEATQLLGKSTNSPVDDDGANPTPSSRLTDGRERFVSAQIWLLYRRGWHDAQAMSREVFNRLVTAADLRRPHASGAKYDLAFVRARVESTLQNQKPIFMPGPRPAGRALELAEGDKDAFRHRVNAAGATGLLRRSSVLVSHAMLGSIGVANSAFVSTYTIAHRTGLAVDTVKRARRELRENGFWIAVDDAGGRSKVAHYLPNIDGQHD